MFLGPIILNVQRVTRNQKSLLSSLKIYSYFEGILSIVFFVYMTNLTLD